jgi:ABC-2 type transport system ATP-binding protein
MADSPVAAFEQVSKVYRSGWLRRVRIPAVRDVTLAISRGEVFGLLGPNRAGKTTLVKLLLSLCRPTQGCVFRFGRDAADQQTLARVGYLHETHAFPSYLTAEGLMHFYGALAHVPPRVLRDRVPALLKRVDLESFRRVAIGRFSKGMRQRLALAQALLNDPDLLVFDEPSEGLDIDGRRLVREAITERKQAGKSVLLVSHVLTEAEKLCDRVGVLVEGRLVFLGPVQNLTRTPEGTFRPIEHALQQIYQS